MKTRSFWRQMFVRKPLWIWLALACLSGSLVGLGGFTFAYAEGAAYLSNDPQACVNCHVMQEVFEHYRKLWLWRSAFRSWSGRFNEGEREAFWRTAVCRAK